MNALQEEVGRLKEMGVNVGLVSNDDATHVVRLALDTDFLNKFTARQWGIVPKKPVVIQLKFEDAYTAADDIPGIFIFQSSDPRLSEPSLNDYETEFGVVQWFLETRLTEVLRSNWEKRPDAVRTRPPSPSSTNLLPSTNSSTTTSITTTPTKSNTTSTTISTTTTPASPCSPSSPSSKSKRQDSGIDLLQQIPIDTTFLEQLKGVGFDEEKSRSALQRFTNNFEMALNFLLTEMAGDGDAVVKMEIDSKSSTSTGSTSTPEKGKKRSLSVSDDDNFAKLVGMGFDLDDVTEVLAAHPTGTSFDVLQSDLNNRSKHTPKKQKSSGDYKEKIEVLKGLGLTINEATNALEMAQGDLASAVEIADGRQSADTDDEDSLTFVDQTEDFQQHTPTRRRIGKKGAALPASKGKKKSTPLPDKLPAKYEVNLWTEPPAFLVNLYNHISMRFITCPGFCLICDRDLDITTYKLPVCGSEVCARVYASTACGKNQVVAEIKEQPAVVELLLNLLCACMSSPVIKGWNRNGNVLSKVFDGSDGSGASSGTRGGRGRHVAYGLGGAGQAPQSFEPFPYNLGFEDYNGNQNIALLSETVNKIPPVSELKQCSSDVHLQALLDEVATPLAFPLLRWLLRSSRAHLSLIPEHKQIKEMGTPYQFQIVSTNPEHERTFQKWKQQSRYEKPQHDTKAQRQQNLAMYAHVSPPKYVPRPGGGFMIQEDPPASSTSSSKANKGSFHAFHGSPISNWHSIVRTGLRGGHVPGIYMAQAAAVSQGYMQSGTACSGWKNSTWDCDKSMVCMGMVEVADMCHHPKMLTGGSPLNVPDAALPGIINVAMDYSIVVTRFLFFWPRGLFPDIDLTKNPNLAYGSPFQNVIASKLIKNEFLFIDDEEESNV